MGAFPRGRRPWQSSGSSASRGAGTEIKKPQAPSGGPWLRCPFNQASADFGREKAWKNPKPPVVMWNVLFLTLATSFRLYQFCIASLSIGAPFQKCQAMKSRIHKKGFDTVRLQPSDPLPFLHGGRASEIGVRSPGPGADQKEPLMVHRHRCRRRTVSRTEGYRKPSSVSARSNLNCQQRTK